MGAAEKEVEALRKQMERDQIQIRAEYVHNIQIISFASSYKPIARLFFVFSTDEKRTLLRCVQP